MNSKFDTTTRERKMSKRNTKHPSALITMSSRNINNDRLLDKWYKMNNCKRGGKSRHIP